MFAGSSPRLDDSPLIPPPANPRKRKQPTHNASTPDIAGTTVAEDAGKPDTHAVLPSRHALANRPRLTISRHPFLTPFAELGGEVYHAADCPAFNHIGFRYVPAGISPPGSILPCTTIESNPPCFRVSWEDRSQAIKVTSDALGLLGDKGYRSARCNAPLREGAWYMEVKIADNSPGHVRLGFARREAPLNAPVGVDGYSYAVRDLTGDKVHLGRPRPYGRPFGAGDVVGMYISLPPLRKPDPKDPADPAHIQRERIAIEVKGQEYFESLEYPVSKEMQALMDGKASTSSSLGATGATLDNASSNPSSAIPTSHPTSPSKKSATVKNIPHQPGSKPKPSAPSSTSTTKQPPPLRPLPTLGRSSRIAFFVNGEPQGIAFQDLLSYLPLRPHNEKGKRKKDVRERGRDGGPKVHWENAHDDGTTGYYPMVSLFGQARVRINAGPDFAFPPPNDVDALLDVHTREWDGNGGREQKKWRPACERYPEYMQEQWALDREEEAQAKVEWERRDAEPEKKAPARKKARTTAAAGDKGPSKKKKANGGAERDTSLLPDAKERERTSSVLPESKDASQSPHPPTPTHAEDDRFGPGPYAFAPAAPTQYSYPMPSAPSYNIGSSTSPGTGFDVLTGPGVSGSVNGLTGPGHGVSPLARGPGRGLSPPGHGHGLGPPGHGHAHTLIGPGSAGLGYPSTVIAKREEEEEEEEGEEGGQGWAPMEEEEEMGPASSSPAHMHGGY